MTLSIQGDLFETVVQTYVEAGDGEISNDVMYRAVAAKLGINDESLNELSPIGKSGKKHSVLKRSLRWFQQDLKRMGVIERTGERGVWRLASVNKKGLHEAPSHVKLVAFSTKLGVAVWGNCESVFAGLDQPITLCITSPPYLIKKERAYGNPKGEQEYIEFLCRALEPVINHLAPGGSLCINISNDSFLSNSPARSLYRERLVLALHERFGLFKMDEIPWVNLSRPPSPVAWASKKRVQLNSGYEVIYWFTNDPSKVRSDNRRVLEEHSRRHLDFMLNGGEKRATNYGDGAYRLREGSFSRVTEGRIPRNVLMRGHNCADTRQYRRDAAELGLPIHGAMSPLSIPDFLIRFLTDKDELVVDPFGGTVKTGMAAERNGRRWIVVERVLEYLRGSAERFRPMDGFRISPAMERLAGSR